MLRVSALASSVGSQPSAVRRSLAAGALVVAALLVPRVASAETVFEYDGATTGVSGRLIIPCVKVALEAQGDQGGVATSRQGTYGPTITNSNPAGRSFVLQISVTDDNGQGIRLFPPGPCKDGTCQNINVQGVADDGTHLLFHFQMTSPDGLLDPGSIVGFNPQPEPPGDFAGPSAMIVDFGIANARTATVSGALLVLNQSTGRVVSVK
jgi:hypothetical protein